MWPVDSAIFDWLLETALSNLCKGALSHLSLLPNGHLILACRCVLCCLLVVARNVRHALLPQRVCSLYSKAECDWSDGCIHLSLQ